jgi:hypothetical protein
MQRAKRPNAVRRPAAPQGQEETATAALRSQLARQAAEDVARLLCGANARRRRVAAALFAGLMELALEEVWRVRDCIAYAEWFRALAKDRARGVSVESVEESLRSYLRDRWLTA